MGESRYASETERGMHEARYTPKLEKKREYCARARVDEIAEEEWCKKARKRQRAAYARRGAKEKKGERKNKGYIYTGSLYYGEEER